MKKVILIDGNNILFRSYFATAYKGTILRNSKGFPTNALYGFINMINKILEIARGELGYKEGANNNTKYGAEYGLNYNPWCQMFVWWCANKAGISTDIIPKTASCPTAYRWFKGKNQVVSVSNAKAGDIIFFTWDNSDNADHVGIVEVVNGNIITTGLLGDVFKESVKIALSYIKSNCDKLKIDFDMLNNIDIHLHVPEGAVKKEGPSAGIAITTALISALKNKQISSYLALTGEITLRGNILPVGKIKEKIIGASNNNIKKVILPKENEKDVEVLDEVIKKNIKFVYVSNYEEVLKEIKL